MCVHFCSNIYGLIITHKRRKENSTQRPPQPVCRHENLYVAYVSYSACEQFQVAANFPQTHFKLENSSWLDSRTILQVRQFSEYGQVTKCRQFGSDSSRAAHLHFPYVYIVCLTIFGIPFFIARSIFIFICAQHFVHVHCPCSGISFISLLSVNRFTCTSMDRRSAFVEKKNKYFSIRVFRFVVQWNLKMFPSLVCLFS